MKTISFTRGGISLDPSGIVSLNDGMGLRIRCNKGLLWMTVESDEKDYWLQAGESMEIRLPGRVVIEAAQSSELQMFPATGHVSFSAHAEAFC